MSELTIGVDLGGTKMLVGVVDQRGRATQTRASNVAGRNGEELLQLLVGEVSALREAAPAAAALGLGIACTIEHASGRAIDSTHLPWRDYPIRELVTERVGLPVAVDNDANAALLGEHRFGAARGARHAVMFTLGTGIGGGVLANGELYRGASGAGAELGHIVVEAGGERCQGNCPGYGCVEAYASGTAIGRAGARAAARTPDSALGGIEARGLEVDGPAVVEAASSGDAVAREVLREAGRYLGVAIVSTVNALEPELVVVGGGAAIGAGELLLEPARAQVRARSLAPQRAVEVRAAELGAQAGMIGAAVMASDLLTVTGTSEGSA